MEKDIEKQIDFNPISQVVHVAINNNKQVKNVFI